MPRTRLIRGVVIAVVIVGVVGVALVVGLMAFVFSIGTATVTLDVQARVVDKDSRRPVAGCVLAFEREQSKGYGHTSAPTDASGLARHEVGYSFTGSPLMYWDRDRHPSLTFYLGAPPRYDSADEVETWVVNLSFDQPSDGTRLTPQVRVERRLSFENTQIDGKFRQAGWRPLPEPDAGALEPIEMVFGRGDAGRPRWEVHLNLTFDAAQIAACTRPQPRPS